MKKLRLDICFKFILKIEICILGIIILNCCTNKNATKSQINKSSDISKKTDCITIMCINDTNKYNRLNYIFQKNNLAKISGIEYLDILKNIKCAEITIEHECYQRSGWIKKEELKEIFAKVDSKEPCPKVRTLSDEIRSDVVDLDSLFIPKSTIGRESIRLINSYYLGFYPCDIKYNRYQIDSLLSR